MIDIQAGVAQWRDQGRAAYQHLGYSPALSADPISMLGLCICWVYLRPIPYWNLA